MAGQVRPAYFLYHNLWTALDWLFPPTCGGCNTLGVRWCKNCQQQVMHVSGRVCACCGDPLAAKASTDLCGDCQYHPPAYQKLRSFGVFESVLRKSLHRLKYQNDPGVAEALSKHLIELYNDFKWDINLITPVPLSKQRIKERGYNQSDLLARPLAYAIDKPYQPKALWRIRETRTQVGLSAEERRQNVDEAFSADPGLVKGKTVLVIDDVTTTGSTISACAKALLQTGASAVFGLTLARAVLQADVDDQPTTFR
jgi:ComF family protein